MNKTRGFNILRRSSGFTIVELLVVIVVIGILAAITIVSYTGITSRAAKATLQSDLKNASTQLGIDNVTNGSYPETEAEANNNKGLPKSSGTAYQYVSTAASYCISASSIAAGSTTYRISSTNGTVETGACMMMWKQIAGGQDYTCAIAYNNLAYCWGNNEEGQFGNNSQAQSLVPVAVSTSGFLNGKTIKYIATGELHTCAIASDDLAYCWGYNDEGELGINSPSATTQRSLVPLAVNTTNGVSALYNKTVKAIDAGWYRTCAIASDDLAYCWGYNGSGELGNNSTSRSLVPVAVNTAGALNGKTVKSITTGYGHTCAIASDNLAYCWGENWDGELGDNRVSGNYSTVPVAVNMTNGVSALYGKTVKTISAGGYFTCVIASDDLAYCWGRGSRGALGNNSTSQSNVPVAVDRTGVLSGKTILAIEAGYWNVCAIASDNHAYCWGYNFNGELGNNSNVQSNVPVTVYDVGVINGKTMTSISTGMSSAHTCTISSDNLAYCWGFNDNGALGDNSTNDSSIPVSVLSIP